MRKFMAKWPAKVILWEFVELGFVTILAIMLIYLILGQGSGVFVTVGGRKRHEVRERRADAKLDRTGAGSGRHLPDHESPEPHALVETRASTAARLASGSGPRGFGVEGASLRKAGSSC